MTGGTRKVAARRSPAEALAGVRVDSTTLYHLAGAPRPVAAPRTR